MEAGLKESTRLLSTLNWSLGPSNIHETNFESIRFDHLPFPRLAPPFSRYCQMRVCLPNSRAYDDEGDPLRYAVIEVGDQHAVQLHARSSLDYAKNTLIPAFNAANTHVALEDAGRTILRP